MHNKKKTNFKLQVSFLLKTEIKYRDNDERI